MFDENSLVERVLSGDEDAFARLVARLEPRVYQYALRYLGEEQEARQATIETFNQVYRKLHRNMELRLSIWTLRLAADVCADIQKRKRGGKSSMAVFRLREIPHGKHGKKQAAMDLDAAIQSQLLRLTRQRREVLLRGFDWTERCGNRTGAPSWMSAACACAFRARAAICASCCAAGRPAAAGKARRGQGTARIFKSCAASTWMSALKMQTRRRCSTTFRSARAVRHISTT